MVMPAGVHAATLFNRSSGLGDLFTLDKLFSNSSSGILSGGNSVNLGDLFVLNKLFPVKTTAATAATTNLATTLAGRIVIQTQAQGQAWYIDPVSKKRIFLDGPTTAYNTMIANALGISNADFANLSTTVPSNVKGRFIIKTEDHGKLYYVNPVNNSITYIGSPSDAQMLIKTVGLGITNSDLSTIAVKS
jgi:hypothetical protein